MLKNVCKAWQKSVLHVCHGQNMGLVWYIYIYTYMNIYIYTYEYCDFNLCHMVLPESIRVPATICHAWLPKGSPHIMPMCTFAGHRARGGCTTGCDPKVKRIAFPAAGVFWEP